MTPRTDVSIVARTGRGIWLETSRPADDPQLMALLDELWHGEAVVCATCKADVRGRTVWHARDEHDRHGMATP